MKPFLDAFSEETGRERTYEIAAAFGCSAGLLYLKKTGPVPHDSEMMKLSDDRREK